MPLNVQDGETALMCANKSYEGASPHLVELLNAGTFLLSEIFDRVTYVILPFRSGKI